jgi:hypothetical protein
MDFTNQFDWLTTEKPFTGDNTTAVAPYKV